MTIELTKSDQHRLWQPTLLALWMAAQMLGLRQDKRQIKIEMEEKTK